MKLVIDAPATEGTTVGVTVLDDLGAPMPGATVRVSYRPGLDASRELSLGVTDGLGRVRWPIDTPGRTEILIGEERLPVAVGFAQPPVQTVTLLALLLLFSAGSLVLGVSARRRR